MGVSSSRCEFLYYSIEQDNFIIVDHVTHLFYRSELKVYNYIGEL